MTAMRRRSARAFGSVWCGLSTSGRGTDDVQRASSVEVDGGGERRGIDPRLDATRTYRVTGRVFDAATGQPLPQAAIAVTAGGGVGPFRAFSGTRSGPEGYEVAGLAPSSCMFSPLTRAAVDPPFPLSQRSPSGTLTSKAST